MGSTQDSSSSKNGSSSENSSIPEEEDSEEEKKNLFDPQKIDVSVETRSLDSLIARIEHNEIDLYPSFQRRADLWGNQVMVRLIESILIRFPL